MKSEQKELTKIDIADMDNSLTQLQETITNVAKETLPTDKNVKIKLRFPWNVVFVSSLIPDLEPQMAERVPNEFCINDCGQL